MVDSKSGSSKAGSSNEGLIDKTNASSGGDVSSEKKGLPNSDSMNSIISSDGTDKLFDQALKLFNDLSINMEEKKKIFHNSVKEAAFYHKLPKGIREAYNGNDVDTNQNNTVKHNEVSKFSFSTNKSDNTDVSNKSDKDISNKSGNSNTSSTESSGNIPIYYNSNVTSKKNN